MNQVFITCPVGRMDEMADSRSAARLGPIVVYVLACAISGTLVGGALGIFGEALRGIDPSEQDTLLSSVVVGAMLSVAVFQLLGRSNVLPQRRRQVPRRWLGWPSRSLTAAAYGMLIGGGAFTYLGYATMYTLALAALASAPMIAALVGAVYGTARGATLLLSWALRSFGVQPFAGFGDAANVVLAALGVSVALTFAVSSLL